MLSCLYMVKLRKRANVFPARCECACSGYKGCARMDMHGEVMELSERILALLCVTTSISLVHSSNSGRYIYCQ